MPLTRCDEEGKKGWKFGDAGKCYVYPAGDEAAEKRAKAKAAKQAVAMGKQDELAEDDLRLLAEDDDQLLDANRLLADDGKKLCVGCNQIRAHENFRDDRRTADGYSTRCVTCRGRDLAEDEDLPTVDLPGVEILAEGGPYFGKGSPPEGDFFDRDFLDAIAANGKRLASEVKPPLKLGHSKEQKLLGASGLLDEGEKPAAGWIDPESLRVEDGEDGKARLLGDVVKVPKKLSKLIKAGSFRRRSAEIGRALFSQNGEKDAEPVGPVLTGLALLGAKAPAIRTLGDWIAQFEEVEPGALDDEFAEIRDDDVAPIHWSSFAETNAVVWRPEEGFEAIRQEVTAALSEKYPSRAGNEPSPSPYWVRDVAVGRALVESWEGGSYRNWIVPFSRNDEGRVTLAEQEEWVEAKQAWVKAAREYAAVNDESEAAVKDFARSADTRAMLTDEMVTKFAEVFGIDETDATKRRELVVAKFAEASRAETDPSAPAPEPPAPDPAPEPPAANEKAGVTLSEAEYEVLRANAEAGKRAADALLADRKARVLDAAKNKIDPAKKEFWSAQFDEDPDRTETLLAELPVNPEFVNVYGEDDEPTGNLADDDAYYRAYVEATDGPLAAAQIGGGN